MLSSLKVRETLGERGRRGRGEGEKKWCCGLKWKDGGGGGGGGGGEEEEEEKRGEGPVLVE